MSAFSGEDSNNFSNIVCSIILSEDFEIEKPSEKIADYLKKLEGIGTLTVFENEDGVCFVKINKNLPKIFVGRTENAN